MKLRSVALLAIVLCVVFSFSAFAQDDVDEGDNEAAISETASDGDVDATGTEEAVEPDSGDVTPADSTATTTPVVKDPDSDVEPSDEGSDVKDAEIKGEPTEPSDDSSDSDE